MSGYGYSQSVEEAFRYRSYPCLRDGEARRDAEDVNVQGIACVGLQTHILAFWPLSPERGLVLLALGKV